MKLFYILYVLLNIYCFKKQQNSYIICINKNKNKANYVVVVYFKSININLQRKYKSL